MNPSSIRVEVFGGFIRRGGFAVDVNPRERTLLYALVAARRPLSREDLHAALWPDLNPDAARNALGVCVHRLRRALGVPNAIVRSLAGYALGDGVRVDLWEAEDLERRLRRSTTLGASELTAAHALFATLLSASRAAGPSGEGAAAFAMRAESVRRALGLRLAEDALGRGDSATALRCAGAILQTDGCDEAACELAMRAHLLEHDRGSAIREFRTYQRIVESELELQPSSHLREMLLQAV